MCLEDPEIRSCLDRQRGASGGCWGWQMRFGDKIGAMAAVPFGVVSGQGSKTRERDTSSRRQIREGRYLLLMPSCVILKRC